jgi:WhiB family transcriptional regulator, redox-sensing transcriptional regulator
VVDALLAAKLLPYLAAQERANAWMRDALCREEPWRSLPWLPVKGERQELMRRVCARCLVRDECYEYAIGRPDLDGIWADSGARARSRARKAAAA